MSLSKARIDEAIFGCLLGCAVGDSLGLPFEGLERGRLLKFRPEPIRQRLVFGRGMLSDDTEHLCLTSHALAAAPRDPELFGKALGWQLRRWFAALPPATGLATLRACSKLCVGFSYRTSGVHSAGNGPAMRAPIIGVCLGESPLLGEYVRISTRITHTNPKAFAGAMVIAHAASLAVMGERVDPKRFLDDLRALPQMKEHEEMLSLVGAACESAERGDSTVELSDSLGLANAVTGYMFHTVPAVIHAWLAHQFDFTKTITQIILCGGDTDSTAAIAGAIAGAQLGPQGIPADYRGRIADWPRTQGWLSRTALETSNAARTGESMRPPRLPFTFMLLRNLAFLTIVLGHGFRRLLPPY